MPLPRIWLNFFSPTTERIAITIGVKGPFAAILPMFKSSAPVFLSEVCQRSGHGTLTSVAIDMSPCPCLPPGVYLGRSFPSASYFAASPGCGYASATAGARAGSREGQQVAFMRWLSRQKGTCTGRAAEAAEAKEDPRSCTAAELTPKASAPPTAQAAATNASTVDFAIIGLQSARCGSLAEKSLECQVMHRTKMV